MKKEVFILCLILFSSRRPHQNRQPGTAGGQGNTGASGGHRGGNKEPLQPANMPVAKSMS